MLNSSFHPLGEGGKPGFVTAAVASKCVVGLMGSDRNFEQAEGSANLGSDPNNPHSTNPRMASAVASNCVVLIDRLLFVFILAPLSPPALSRPAGRKREPTALFGRMFKARKYPLDMHVGK